MTASTAGEAKLPRAVEAVHGADAEGVRDHEDVQRSCKRHRLREERNSGKPRCGPPAGWNQARMG